MAMIERPDYMTGLQQCAQCEGWKLVLEDGICYACLYPPPPKHVQEYGVSLWRDDGTHDQTFRFFSESAARKTFGWFYAIDPRRVKFETFPPAGSNEPGYIHRAVRPEPAVPEVAAGALRMEDR